MCDVVISHAIDVMPLRELMDGYVLLTKRTLKMCAELPPLGLIDVFILPPVDFHVQVQAIFGADVGPLLNRPGVMRTRPN